MPFDCVVKIPFSEFGRQAELRIEGVQFEEIAMGTARRARTAIARTTKIADALLAHRFCHLRLPG